MSKLDFKLRYGDVAKLPSFGMKFSVNGYARFCWQTYSKTNPRSDIARPVGEDSSKYDDELNLSNPLI